MLGYGKSVGGCDYGKIAMILMGIGMIVFASTCFKEVPIIGTVLVMPGEDVMDARMIDPVFRDALFLLGGMFTAYGIRLQIKIGFTNPLKQSNQDAVLGKPGEGRGLGLEKARQGGIGSQT